MDYGICNGCRSLSRISTAFAVVLVSLVLTSVKVSSVELDEQECKPRPTIVELDRGHRPFHILLYRCSGTCDVRVIPKHKPCKAKTSTEIRLKVADPSSGKVETIKVYNHTSCSCDCEFPCDWDNGEEPGDFDKCTCKSGPQIGPATAETRHEPKAVDVLPYKIGLAVMGFVTLCVVVFEMIMCAKRKKVLERVKESCCKKEDHSDDKGQNENVTTV